MLSIVIAGSSGLSSFSFHHNVRICAQKLVGPCGQGSFRKRFLIGQQRGGHFPSGALQMDSIVLVSIHSSSHELPDVPDICAVDASEKTYVRAPSLTHLPVELMALTSLHNSECPMCDKPSSGIILLDLSRKLSKKRPKALDFIERY